MPGEATTTATTIKPPRQPPLLGPPRGRRFVFTAGLACLLLPIQLRAQLPAPPASARGPLRLGGYGTIVLGHTSANEAAPASGVAGSSGGTASGGAAPAASGAALSGSSGRSGVVGSAAALLLAGTIGSRLSYLGEVDGATRSWENRPGRRDDRVVELARLYAEISAGDALRLRAGRFLTPIGQWNEIHADPLTWTTQRPLTTYRPFAKSITGAMLAGQVDLGGHDAGYAVFAAPFGTGHAGQETAFVRGIGGRVAMELLPGLYLGASTAHFRASWPYSADEDSVEENGGGAGGDYGGETAASRARAVSADVGEVGEPGDREEDTAPRRLHGLDLSWSIDRAELLAEAVVISAGAGHPAERGGFAQAAVPLIAPLYLVLRAEAYDPVVHEPVSVQTVGAVVRPGGHLTIKLERQFTDRPSPRVPAGWFASVSAIF